MFRITKTLLQPLKLGNALLEHMKNSTNKSLFCMDELIIKRVPFKGYCTNENSATDNTGEPNFFEVTQGDPDLEHKLKVLLLELDVSRQDGRLVPQNTSLNTGNWQELLKLPSISARRKYLMYLFKLEKTKENRLKQKEEKRLERELNPRPKKEDNVLNYDLGHNNMFLRFYDSSMNNMYNNRLIQAMQFGQQLVIDCGYDQYMTIRENNNCAKQLMLLFSENRFADEPFDLHFCNTNRESGLIKGLHKHIPTLYEPSFPINIHDESYLDIFPKDKLVYLTPHCRDVLQQFDHDSVYIIGAIVDKVNNDPLSLAKAKKEGIRMAKLPLDHYLDWGSGSGKSLTINQVLSILVDIKRTGNWKHALRHVPRRKLADFSQEVSLRKFNQAIGYTGGVENRKNAIQRPWRPSEKTNVEKIGYKSNIRSSFNLKNMLQDNNK